MIIYLFLTIIMIDEKQKLITWIFLVRRNTIILVKQLIIKCLWNEILSNYLLIPLQKLQCNFLGRISLTLFLLEIFNFIRYGNYATYDIIGYNNFSKLIVNLQRDRHFEHKNDKTKKAINRSLRMYSALLLISCCHMLQNQPSQRHSLCTEMS